MAHGICVAARSGCPSPIPPLLMVLSVLRLGGVDLGPIWQGNPKTRSDVEECLSAERYPHSILMKGTMQLKEASGDRTNSSRRLRSVRGSSYVAVRCVRGGFDAYSAASRRNFLDFDHDMELKSPNMGKMDLQTEHR